MVLPKKTFILVLVLLGCGQPLTAQQAISQASPSAYKFPAGKSCEIIPFQEKFGHLMINVQINGRGVEAILDTGMPADGILLTGETDTVGMGLTYVSKMGVGGAGGGSVQADLAMGAAVTLGEIALENQMVVAMPPAAEKRVHAGAVIGFAVFGRFVVDIDYINRKLTLYEQARFTPDPKMAALDLELKNNFPFAKYSIVQADGAEVSLTTTIDIGASHNLGLRVGRPSSIVVPKGAVEFRIGRGITRDIDGYVGRVKSLKFGPFVLHNLVATFDPGLPQGPAQLSPDGNLGAGVMKRFDVVFDYGAKRLYIKPNRAFTDPSEFNMSGAQFTKRTDDTFSIDRIVPGSGAEKAGLAVKDVIIKVNDRPAGDVSGDEMERLTITEGNILRLTVLRDGQPVDLDVQLSRVI